MTPIYFLLGVGCKRWTPLEYLNCNAFSEIYKVLLPLTCMSICVFYNKEGDYSSFTTILIAYRKAQDILSGVELFTISPLVHSCSSSNTQFLKVSG